MKKKRKWLDKNLKVKVFERNQSLRSNSGEQEVEKECVMVVSVRVFKHSSFNEGGRYRRG